MDFYGAVSQTEIGINNIFLKSQGLLIKYIIYAESNVDKK